MVLNRKEAADKEKLKEVQSYREAFDHYDWTKNGTIPIKVSKNIFFKGLPQPPSHGVRVVSCTGQDSVTTFLDHA